MSKSYPPEDDSKEYSSSSTNDPILPTSSGWRQHPLINHRRHFASPWKLLFFLRASRPLTRYALIFVFVITPLYFLSVFTGYVKPPPQFQEPPQPEWVFPSGAPKVHPEVQRAWNARADIVKDSFLHVYRNYMEHAFPADEIRPFKGEKINNFNGWGVTTVDSLDTMLIMGLNEEFDRGVQHVAALDFKRHRDFVPFFETTIRYFGGLLSAYHLSLNMPASALYSTKQRSEILLQKVDELATALSAVFNTPSGLPVFATQPSTGYIQANWGENRTILADAGTCQLEYKMLSHLTGKQDYFKKVDNILDYFEKYQNKESGMLATFWSTADGSPMDAHYSMGGLADSGHEYLLKGYLLSNRSEQRLLDMYLKTTEGIIDNLLYLSPTRDLLYVTDVQNKAPSHVLEELACFLPGLFALGSHLIPPTDIFTPRMRQQHLWIAKGLATTCYLLFADSVSGLAPDEVTFDDKGKPWKEAFAEWERWHKWKPGASATPPGVAEEVPVEKNPKKRDYVHRRTAYLLRPETVESLFVLWRVTGEMKWRERGWEIFEAIEKHSRGKFGYASISYVDIAKPDLLNETPSYFLAETLKYLWLLFAEGDGGIPIERYIFNTEAHPLPIFDWSPEEKAAYGIK